MVWALFLSFFNGFQQRRFGIFPAAVSQWLGHKTCWGSAFSLPFYTTTLQMHYNALTLTSNSMTEQEYWFFDSDSSSNQSVQSRRCVWILLVMLASASSLHIQLLSSDSSAYFKATFQHIIKICTFITKEPNKNKPHEIPHTPDGYRKQNQHRNLMKFFGKHKSVHVLRKEKKQSGSCMLRSSKSDSTCCTVVHLNSAKICFDTSCCLFC